jgi:DNA-binding XRE family transcriptional regulator
MAIKADDFLASLPDDEQAEIRERAAELLAEEATLRQLREAREQSQKELAEKLGVNQAAVSKLERRSDLYLSTLRGYIEAMGGELYVVARFPDRVVRIDLLSSLGDGRRGGKPRRRGRRAGGSIPDPDVS